MYFICVLGGWNQLTRITGFLLVGSCLQGIPEILGETTAIVWFQSASLKFKVRNVANESLGVVTDVLDCETELY